MSVKRDINGVEYTYANKDEIAFGTTFERDDNDFVAKMMKVDKAREEEIKRESEPEVEIIQLVPRMYAKKLPKEVAQRARAIDGFGE